MELFSEIYGCYFTVVARILEQAQKGVSREEIEKLVSAEGFYDSAFHLLPSLFSGEWNLLEKKENIYYSRLSDFPKRPFTTLEKSWLKALLSDPRIRLFLDEEPLEILKTALTDVMPLYEQDVFYVYDCHRDGDDYESAEYIANFKTILQAIKAQKALIIEYDTPKGGRTKRQYHPYKFSYSSRDDKFRLLCAVYNNRQNRVQRAVLNLGRMTAVENAANQIEYRLDLAALFHENEKTEPVVLEIFRERNALERSMLQFASFERQTEYDRDRDTYICRIWYDPADETELLIRILSFGPVVKVHGPKGFLRQVKERIARQIKLNEKSI